MRTELLNSFLNLNIRPWNEHIYIAAGKILDINCYLEFHYFSGFVPDKFFEFCLGCVFLAIISIDTIIPSEYV